MRYWDAVQQTGIPTNADGEAQSVGVRGTTGPSRTVLETTHVTLCPRLTAFSCVLETAENTNSKVMDEFALQGTLKPGQVSLSVSWLQLLLFLVCSEHMQQMKQTERENVPFDKERRKFEVSGNMTAE